jgi:Putative undecaprenyl diphosphate synthase
MRSPHEQLVYANSPAFYVGLPSSHALKLPIISRRELKRAARPFCHLCRFVLSTKYFCCSLFWPFLFPIEPSSSLSTQPTMTTRLRKWLISSPPAEWVLYQIRELLIGALRQGPIPRHVAFVMDGNRRYARSHRIETVEGHNLGFEALARVGFAAEWAVNHEADTSVRLDPRSVLQVWRDPCHHLRL